MPLSLSRNIYYCLKLSSVKRRHQHPGISRRQFKFLIITCQLIICSVLLLWLFILFETWILFCVLYLFGLKYASHDFIQYSLLESFCVEFFFFFPPFWLQETVELAERGCHGDVHTKVQLLILLSTSHRIVQQSFICSYLNSDWGHNIHANEQVGNVQYFAVAF